MLTVTGKWGNFGRKSRFLAFQANFLGEFWSIFSVFLIFEYPRQFSTLLYHFCEKQVLYWVLKLSLKEKSRCGVTSVIEKYSSDFLDFSLIRKFGEFLKNKKI